MIESKSVFEFQEPVERVWSSITIYEILIHWLADEVRGRPKEGAEFSWTWKLGIEGDFTTHGIYRKIVPLKELVLEWKDHPAGELTLDLIFESIDQKTSRLTIVNRAGGKAEDVQPLLDGLAEAWEEQVKSLKDFLATNPDFNDSKFKKKV